MKSIDVMKYDFVGVRIDNQDPALEGIFRFKKGFGGDLKEGYLWKRDIKPIRAKLYDLLIRIRHVNRPVYRDIIDQINS